VEIFIQSQEKEELYGAFTDETFQFLLAYLLDVFEAINKLDLKLQGRNANIIAH
jgi:hypothetical protein